MKTDNYLSLCLEQAALSPLHHRHGCIIVRGGKVIGQGYNDHRPGFDGGALKSGRIGTGTYDGSAIADWKQKRKSKQKSDLPTCLDEPANDKPFTPLEGMGGGPRANLPLSMHAEMMAIHSALARSSTLASTAVSSIKPSFKLPGHSKRKARLRNEALKAYVKCVCIEVIQQQSEKHFSVATGYNGRTEVQEWSFEASSNQPSQAGPEWTQRGRDLGQVDQYGETPNEECEESSRERFTVQPSWTTAAATTTATACFQADD
jgi:deoxycytidylate deaminase